MNKKIVILIVVIECILAIFLVGIWGLAVDASRSKITCTDIYFTNESGERYESGTTLEVELEMTEYGATYQLYYKLEPDNITNSQVKFTTNKPTQVVVSRTGEVTFYALVPVEITIKSADGAAKTATIRIVPTENKDVIIDPGFFD